MDMESCRGLARVHWVTRSGKSGQEGASWRRLVWEELVLELELAPDAEPWVGAVPKLAVRCGFSKETAKDNGDHGDAVHNLQHEVAVTRAPHVTCTAR